jgi:hypothetical protein
MLVFIPFDPSEGFRRKVPNKKKYRKWDLTHQEEASKSLKICWSQLVTRPVLRESGFGYKLRVPPTLKIHSPEVHFNATDIAAETGGRLSFCER